MNSRQMKTIKQISGRDNYNTVYKCIAQWAFSRDSVDVLDH